MPDSSAALLQQAEAVALAYLETKGVTPLQAATASFRREGFVEFGLEGFMESEDEAADAWDELEWVVMDAFGISQCTVSLHPSAFDRTASPRQLG